MRIIASAIVALTGAICLGLSVTGTSNSARDAESFGGFLLVAGGVCFAIEFVRTWTGKD